MINKLRRLNEALPGLILGIIIFAALVELIGVWFSSDKLRYTTGTIIGMGCAIFLAINISIVIVDSISLGEGHEKQLAIKSVLRYFVVVAVFIITMKFNLGSMIPAVISVFGLKVSAYAQPLLNKKVFKSKGGED